MARTGQTPDVIREQWDLPMLIAINNYWREIPPVDLLVARYLGYEAPPAENTDGIDRSLMHRTTLEDLQDPNLPAHLRQASEVFLQQLTAPPKSSVH